jgi:putative heme-binding domain-containing protein
MALGKDNTLYFCLGCADYSNAYLLDKAGQAHYDIHSERGTIVKVSPDRQRREVVCTGIRFAIGIAFNRAGDLFATDQEGDTWTKGNHLDELNQILPGRHYGFPEKHPQYLPDVIDEPPIVGYGPQHESTCGLRFNEQTPKRKSFGPPAWEGDALIAGESRGKIWRTTLVKTPAGYVGKEKIVARLDMLTIDIAVSPRGDLVVCCHSGPPDWGTGPTGKGRLFKIMYTDPAAPQPAAAWATSPSEIRVAFDKPIDPSALDRLAGLTIPAGYQVRAGKRMETLRPPYAVVQAEMQLPRHELTILKRRLEDHGRTVVLTTDPLPFRGWYAVALPGIKAVGAPGLGSTVDVDFELGGVDTTWKPDAAIASTAGWSGCLPHIETAIIAGFTKDSASHQELFDHLNQPGTLNMRTRLALPGNRITLHATADTSFTLTTASPTAHSTATGQDVLLRDLTPDPATGLIDFSIQLATGPSAKLSTFHLTYSTDADPRERSLPLEAFLPPWVPTLRHLPSPPSTQPIQSPLTAGGDWNRGKALFFGEAKCATCHVVKGEGGRIGPDLSNLLHLNPESVLRDIVDPNATINPDYASYTLTLKSGEKLTGVLQPDGDNLRVVESVDKTTTVRRDDVKEARASNVSLMPEGFKALGDEKLRDLLTYLTTPPPKGVNK